MNFGTVTVTAGLAGLLSFSLLATALGSDYWYIIEVDRENHTNAEDSHSGLWRIYEGENGSFHYIPTFTESSLNCTEPERRLLRLHKVIVIVLPLSLVLLVFGGICGLVSSLARSYVMLSGTASYFLICSLLTLSGVSVYINYSQQALEELKQELGVEQLANVHMSFGWSLAVACLSFCLEVATGLLLLLAARMATQKQWGEIASASSTA